MLNAGLKKEAIANLSAEGKKTSGNITQPSKMRESFTRIRKLRREF